jgi:hypothetical protein
VARLIFWSTAAANRLASSAKGQRLSFLGFSSPNNLYCFQVLINAPLCFAKKSARSRGTLDFLEHGSR